MKILVWLKKFFVEEKWHRHFLIFPFATYLIAMVSYHMVYEPVIKLIRMAVKAIAKEKTI